MFNASNEVKETRLRDMYKTLQNDGIDVYFQGQHKGDCIDPYVVLLSRGETQYFNYSSTEGKIEVLCYVPISTASELDLFVEKVRKSLKYLHPMVKDAYNDIGDYIDNDIKAVLRTLQYNYYRKID